MLAGLIWSLIVDSSPLSECIQAYGKWNERGVGFCWIILNNLSKPNCRNPFGFCRIHWNAIAYQFRNLLSYSNLVKSLFLNVKKLLFWVKFSSFSICSLTKFIHLFKFKCRHEWQRKLCGIIVMYSVSHWHDTDSREREWSVVE